MGTRNACHQGDWSRGLDCCHALESDLEMCAVDLKLLGRQSECLANTNGCVSPAKVRKRIPPHNKSGKGIFSGTGIALDGGRRPKGKWRLRYPCECSFSEE